MFVGKLDDTHYVMDMREDLDPSEHDAHDAEYNRLVKSGVTVQLVPGGEDAAKAELARRQAAAKNAKRKGGKSSKHGKKPIAYFEIATQMLPEYFDWDDDELQAVGDVAAMLDVMLARLDAVDGCEVDEAYGNLHDRDTHERWNELTNSYDIVPKEEHPHLIFHFASGKGLTVPDIAEALGIAENMIDKPGRGQRWEGALAYQIHAKDADKAQYDPRNVVTARGPDYMDVWRDNKASWERGRAVKSRKAANTPASVDWLEAEILAGRMDENRMLLDDDLYAVYSRNSGRLDNALRIYENRQAARALKAFEDNDFTPCILYVWGEDGGEGKTSAFMGLSKWLHDFLEWKIDEVSSEHPGDHLTGAEILLLDDCEATSLSASDWLGLFDEKRAIKASARYKDKPKQKARVVVIFSNERPLEFFSQLHAVHGSSASRTINKFFRRLQRYVRVVHPNDYGYLNWFLEEPTWSEKYVEVMGGTRYELRWRFQSIEKDMVYSPYAAMEQVARLIDVLNKGIISSRPDADEMFAALADYVYREYHPDGIEHLRNLPPLPERKLLPDKTSWTELQSHREQVEAMERMIEEHGCYEEYCSEFYFCEEVERAGRLQEFGIDEGWRGGFHGAVKMPTFVEWRKGVKGIDADGERVPKYSNFGITYDDNSR